MQRVVMNLGIGLGGARRRLHRRPESFRVLFLLDALTFVVYAGVLTFVPEPAPAEERAERPGSYRTVLRHRVFMALMVA